MSFRNKLFTRRVPKPEYRPRGIDYADRHDRDTLIIDSEQWIKITLVDVINFERFKMKVWCARCGFKFEQSTKGRKAKICPSCRRVRENEWRATKAAKEEQKHKPKEKINLDAV